MEVALKMIGVSIFAVMFFGKLSYIFKSNCVVKGHYEFAALFLVGLIVNLTSLFVGLENVNVIGFIISMFLVWGIGAYIINYLHKIELRI
jgi:hypothetical protein